jgi:hypothetical protein
MFSFEDGGEPGLEREMVEAFARSRGLEVEIVQVERFEDVIPTLLEGRGDLITGIINTPQRREKIAFTRETLPARHVAVSRKPRGRVTSLSELDTLRVGTVAGSSWTHAALEAGVPRENLVEAARAQQVLEDLRQGAVDVVVMSVTDFAQAQREDASLQAGFFVGSVASRVGSAPGGREAAGGSRRVPHVAAELAVLEPDRAQVLHPGRAGPDGSGPALSPRGPGGADPAGGPAAGPVVQKGDAPRGRL